MRKLSALLLILCFVITLCSCGSGDTAPTADGEMTAVTDNSGKIIGYERRYHNADGNLSRLDVYDAEQVYLRFTLYEYDDEGLLSTETEYAADGIAKSRYVYSYSDDGKLTEKAYELPSGEAEVTKFDSDGDEVEKLYYDSDGKLYLSDKLTEAGWVSSPSEI